MLSWEWPWVFLLIPLPLLVRWLLPAKHQSAQAIRVPFYEQLNSIKGQQKGSSTSVFFKLLCVFFIWLCLLCAAARPVWVGDSIPVPQDSRDLMLAVDISRSMEATDMRINNRNAMRIDAVKFVVGDFIQQRAGDRIGLILFGEQAYLQTPLTFDTQTVQQQLFEAQLGFAGNATAIGDAIGLAVKRLRDRPAESRVLVLLTDGANSAGSNPRQAMTIAAEANIRIHTVGVGNPSFGRGTGDIDEALLSEIANITGGKFFRARSPNELLEIYAELDRLEPMPEELTFRPSTSLAHWPLALALILSFLMAAIRICQSKIMHAKDQLIISKKEAAQ